MFLFGILLVALAQGQVYNTSLYTLGPNLVANPSFESPSIGATMFTSYSGSISGWTCSTTCQIVNILVLCTNFALPCSHNYTQGIDLDSFNVFELIRQNVTIPASGSYVLGVEYMSSVTSPVGKKMSFKVNGTVVGNVTTGSNYSYQKV